MSSLPLILDPLVCLLEDNRRPRWREAEVPLRLQAMRRSGLRQQRLRGGGGGHPREVLQNGPVPQRRRLRKVRRADPVDLRGRVQVRARVPPPVQGALLAAVER